VGISFVSWVDMTTEQKEYTVYAFAAAHMVEELRWPEVPPEVQAKLRSLSDVWDSVDEEEKS
jgi:hypothetical protein